MIDILGNIYGELTVTSLDRTVQDVVMRKEQQRRKNERRGITKRT